MVAFRRIGRALMSYELHIGAMPKKGRGLAALVVRPKYDTAAKAAKWSGPYLRHVPKDPWGNPYIYEGGAKARLYSTGPDGKEATYNVWAVRGGL